MSTNTTNTNNGTSNGAGRPKSDGPKSKKSGEGLKREPFASIPLPDPALLEKLANEFFLVLPNDLANGNDAYDHPAEADSDEIPTTMFTTEETIPLRETGGFEAGPTTVASPPSSPPGPLTEADLRAIAASLAGETALVPGTPSTAPTPPLPGSPPDFLAEGKSSPIAIAPSLPSGNEIFSFPGVPGVPTSAPTSPPAGADLGSVPSSPGNIPVAPDSTPHFLGGEKGSSPAAAPVFPPINDFFSFPRVPAMPNAAGLETIPKTSASSMPASATPPSTDGTLAPAPGLDPRAFPPQITAVPPGAPTNPATSAVDMSTPSAPVEKATYPGTTSIPSSSELFSFPGVPGVPLPPGIPLQPSSLPSTPPAKTDVLSAPAAAFPRTSVGSIPEPTPATSGAGATTGESAPPEFHSYEFRPDVIPDLGVAKRPLDARLIRRDFPILEERVHGRQLVWLDNAATTQKPKAVIDRLSYFYHHENSNIHRAAHDLAARATDAYESAREKARRFLNASSTREIIFVRGTTEGINLVAQSWGRRNVQKDDEIVITWLEHHANIVPWQQLCSEKGARLRVAPVNDRGEIILDEYERLLGPRTRIVSFTQVSNALGTITPAREMIEMAHRYGARVLLDGAQAVSHMPVDVQALNCDFYVFSGHKVFGPTGIGVLHGKPEVLENMPPWQGGGNMIADVTFEKTTYQPAPERFEAGTGNIADAVGLGAALDYVEQIGMESIAAYEHELLDYGTAGLLTVPGLRLIGTAREKAGVMSFVLDDMRTEDVGVALNEEGIAVRSGHHCAQPILRRMGVESTVRPSIALYNTCEELDQLVATLLRIQSGRGHRGF
jgi:cysteine desulfurase / selenocysteine lyase